MSKPILAHCSLWSCPGPGLAYDARVMSCSRNCRNFLRCSLKVEADVESSRQSRNLTGPHSSPSSRVMVATSHLRRIPPRMDSTADCDFELARQNASSSPRYTCGPFGVTPDCPFAFAFSNWRSLPSTTNLTLRLLLVSLVSPVNGIRRRLNGR
jgi:hypothetical protein